MTHPGDGTDDDTGFDSIADPLDRHGSPLTGAGPADGHGSSPTGDSTDDHGSPPTADGPTDDHGSPLTADAPADTHGSPLTADAPADGHGSPPTADAPTDDHRGQPTGDASPWRHRDFRLAWSAGVVSLTATQVQWIALAYFVFAATGSTGATAALAIAMAAPGIAVAPFAGALVDRGNPRLLLCCANLLLAGVCVAMVSYQWRWWLLLPLGLAQSAVSQLIRPTESVLVVSIVEPRQLIRANGLLGTAVSSARLVGPMAGGLVLAVGGLTTVLLANAALYLVAAMLAWRLRPPGSLGWRVRPGSLGWRMRPGSLGRRVRPGSLAGRPGPSDSLVRRGHPTASPLGRTSSARNGWGRRVARLAGSGSAPSGSARPVGWRTIVADPRLRPVVGVVVATGIGEGVVSALLAPYVATVFGSSALLGAMLAAQAVGGVLTALWLGARRPRTGADSLLGHGLTAAAVVLVPLLGVPLVWPAAWSVLVLSAVAGVPFAVVAAAQSTVLQQRARPNALGTTVGLVGALAAASSMAGGALAGVLSQLWSVAAILVDAGCYLVAAIVWKTLVVRKNDTARGEAGQ